MAAYSRTVAISRARTAHLRAQSLIELTRLAIRGYAISDEAAEDMRESLEFIIEQSHDTTGE